MRAIKIPFIPKPGRKANLPRDHPQFAIQRSCTNNEVNRRALLAMLYAFRRQLAGEGPVLCRRRLTATRPLWTCDQKHDSPVIAFHNIGYILSRPRSICNNFSQKFVANYHPRRYNRGKKPALHPSGVIARPHLFCVIARRHTVNAPSVAWHQPCADVAICTYATEQNRAAPLLCHCEEAHGECFFCGMAPALCRRGNLHLFDRAEALAFPCALHILCGTALTGLSLRGAKRRGNPRTEGLLCKTGGA